MTHSQDIFQINCYGDCRLLPKSRVLLLFFMVFFVNLSLAQKEGNVWYFGYQAGLDFNDGSPMALRDGQMISAEGCASVCDDNGMILFYTNGVNIWNKNHVIMTNGADLIGCTSSSQSSIIVKKPNTEHIYMVFTTDCFENQLSNGLAYSEVDMLLDGGLGAINTNKNIPVHNPVCEKLAVIKHTNNCDYWIVVHEFGSNEFHSYLLNQAGLNHIPIISPIGDIIDGVHRRGAGQLKASIDGSRIAVANSHMSKASVFRFDNSTGMLSEEIVLGGFSSKFPYGVEFSPNSKLVYFTETFDLKLIQYNLEIWSGILVNNSRQIVGDIDNFGSLQLGPGNVIYHAANDHRYLSAVNSPNLIGPACNFDQDAVWLGGAFSIVGLPSFPNTTFASQFTFNSQCFGDSTEFYFGSQCADSLIWDFGDPSTMGLNKSNLLNPKHVFSDPGEFLVSVVYYGNNTIDTARRILEIFTNPIADLGPDTAYCEGQVVTLQIMDNDDNIYIWQDQSSDSALAVSATGYYHVQVLDTNGCSGHDTVMLTFNHAPQVDLGNDINACEGDTVIKTGQEKYANYYWSTGDTTNSITILDSDLYWLKVIDTNQCENRDSVNIWFHPMPVVDLGKDTSICEGNSILLNADNEGSQYEWSTNSITQTIDVSESGIFWVTVRNVGQCHTQDTVRIDVISTPTIELGPDMVVCIGDTVTLDAYFSGSTYLWQDGSTDSISHIAETGNYGVLINNLCGEWRDNISINFENCDCEFYIPTAFSPDNNQVNDVFQPYTNCEFQLFNFQIFDRWGNKIFESKSANIGWNGSVNERIQELGVYAYVLSYQFPFQSPKMVSGNITLIR